MLERSCPWRSQGQEDHRGIGKGLLHPYPHQGQCWALRLPRLPKDSSNLALLPPSCTWQGLSEDSQLLQEKSHSMGTKMKHTAPSDRNFFLHFPLVQQSRTCVNLTDGGTTVLELLESPHKHLCHWMAFRNTNGSVQDGSQDNSSGYWGRLKEVCQQWGIAGTETSISPLCLPARTTNKIFLFTTSQGQPSPHPPPWPDRLLCRRN